MAPFEPKPIMKELIPIKGKLGASNRIKQPSMVTIQAIS